MHEVAPPLQKAEATERVRSSSLAEVNFVSKLKQGLDQRNVLMLMDAHDVSQVHEVNFIRQDGVFRTQMNWGEWVPTTLY